MKKKVLIIGSGIGGSGIGALLINTGKYSVELFEKNSLIGGRFSTYEKNGWKLDIGCHLVANCENGTIGWILNEIGKANEVQWSYARNPTPKFYYIDNFLLFPRELIKLDISSEDLKNLLLLMRDLNSFSELELQKLEEEKVDMRTFLSKYTKNMKALSMFSFFTGLYFVVPDFLTPASEWIRCQREILNFKTSGYPIGGTISIPKAYCKFIEEKGGKVHTNTEVKEILIENGKAIGIRTDGGIIEGDIIISNAGVKTTIQNLIGKGLVDEEYFKKMNSYEYSLATIQTKIALDKKITDEKMIMFIGQEIFEEDWDQEAFKERNFTDFLQDLEFHPVLFIPIVSNLDPSLAPEGKQLLIAGGGCPTPSQGFVNKDDKKICEDAIIRSLEKIFPNIRKHILWTETTSPEDINNFVNKDGTVIGIGQTIEQVGVNRPSHEIPGIKNVFCCGADTGRTGIGGELAANSAIELYKKILENN